jgi:hypothetical protein
MNELHKPFIPSWLDDLGLPPAEFRVFLHLCRRADNKTGIAWPSYDSMIETCGMGKSTIRRAIGNLQERKLIATAGKPFGGSCRYRVLPTVSPEGRLEDSNSSISGTIEAAPIVPSQDCNSSISGPPIVPPEGQEGIPKKEIQRRVSNIEISSEGLDFADWFKSTLPESINLPSNWRNSFAKDFHELVRLDKRDPDEIRRVSAWARSDSFWKSNFMSPAKLRKRNKDGIQTFDVLVAKMTTPTLGATNGKTLNLGRRGFANGYNESTSLDHL